MVSILSIQLSQFKGHLFFPIPVADYKWVFLVKFGFTKEVCKELLEIEIYDPDNKRFGFIQMNFRQGVLEERRANNREVVVEVNDLKDDAWKLVYAQLYTSLQKPGTYTIYARFRDKEVSLGEVRFYYIKPPPYTIEQLRAIDSNPYATKSVRVILGCKICHTKILIYCSLERDINTEDEWYIWYQELPGTFSCECGNSVYPLEYLKEGLPNVLGRDINIGQWSYERRYSHEKIENIIDEFNKVLRENKDEPPLQKFIEANPVILARFFAKEIFLKPSINGKYFADFAILNANNELVFIEIERPSLPLFKKSKNEGYPRKAGQWGIGRVR